MRLINKKPLFICCLIFCAMFFLGCEEQMNNLMRRFVTIDEVSITPDTASLGRGQSRQFIANVFYTHHAGTPEEISPHIRVDWKIEGQVGSSSVRDGLVTICENETAETLLLTATSRLEKSKFGTATIHVIREQ